MKKRFIKILLIYIIVILFEIKVEALTGSTTVYELPISTEKSNYITLAHSSNSAASDISIEYSYDTKYLQLVGFIPVSNTNCQLEGNIIKCSNIKANTIFVYPVFKIINTFNANKDISATFNTTVAENTTKTTINKVDKKIEVTSIQLDSNNEELIVNQTYQIVATVLPENATTKTITYTSSDNTIATVSEKGLVTAIAAGEADITITSGNIKTIFKVAVKDEEIPLEKITLAENIEMKVGENKSLDITFEPKETTTDTSKLIYSSSDSKVAIIDSEGKVVAISSGTATITVSLGDQTATTKVTVSEEEVKEKSTSVFIPCLITAIITFVITLTLIFIKNLINRRKELNSEEESLNTYI